ncbi:MAG: TMEM43 family protein [Pseudomonadota bacterium]
MSSVTQTTRTSWFRRLFNSVVGALIGIALVFGAIGLLAWNENRSVNALRTIAEGRELVVTADAARVNSGLDEQLIHVPGVAEPVGQLTDQAFDIELAAIRLRRTVEMFQWEERSETRTRTNTGGSETRETVYTYRKVWSDRAIDSSGFRNPSGHTNPGPLPLESRAVDAEDVRLGAYRLATAYVRKLNDFDILPPTNRQLTANAATLGLALAGDRLQSGDPEAPAVGDLRVTFSVVSPGNYTAMGRQVGGDIVPYEAKHGVIDWIDPGLLSSDEMLALAEQRNSLLTWGLRLGGVVLMFVALLLVLSPLRTAADVIPFAGRIVGAGIGLVAIVAALAVSITVVAVSWFAVRPILSVLLGGLVFVIFMIGGRLAGARQKTGASPSAQTALSENLPGEGT